MSVSEYTFAQFLVCLLVSYSLSKRGLLSVLTSSLIPFSSSFAFNDSQVFIGKSDPSRVTVWPEVKEDVRMSILVTEESGSTISKRFESTSFADQSLYLLSVRNTGLQAVPCFFIWSEKTMARPLDPENRVSQQSLSLSLGTQLLMNSSFLGRMQACTPLEASLCFKAWTTF